MAKKAMGKGKKAILIAAISVAALLVTGCAVFTVMAMNAVSRYEGIYPGVECCGVSLEGKTEEQAVMALQAKSVEDFKDKSFRIVYEDYAVEITATEAGVSYNAEEMAKNAYSFGRDRWILGSYFLINMNNGKHEIEPVINRSTAVVEEKVDAFAKLTESEVTMPSYEVIGTEAIRIDLGEEGRAISRQQVTDDMKARIENLEFGDYTVETTVTPQEAIDLQKIYDEIYCEATEAAIKYVPLDWTEETADQYTEEQLAAYTGKHKYVVMKGQIGMSFDIAAAQNLIDNAEDRIVTIDIIQDIPEDTTEEIEAKIFRDVLGTCTTKLNTGEVNRTHNIDLAAKSVNGTIVCPGDIFSYNGTVGERTAARGYREAKIFAQGEVVDGLGGGICQLSSTVYMATLRSNLEQVSRSPHRYAVSYTPLGQDATVYWGSLDYQFKNNTAYPIKVYADLSGDTVTVKIYGTKVDDYTYQLKSVTDEEIDYEEETVYVTLSSKEAEDNGLTKIGQKKVVGGKKGYKSTTYVIKLNGDGEEVERWVANHSQYKTRTKITYIACVKDSHGNPILDENGKPYDPNNQPTTDPATETSPPPTTQPPPETETQPDTGYLPEPDPGPDAGDPNP